MDLSLGDRERVQSLREICEDAQAAGARTLLIAFDHFWNAYRKAQVDEPRKLLPDTDEYIDRIATIGRFAGQYGIGLELSLISPLELGAGYRRATGDTGRWVQYREGIRDPKSGNFSVQFWRHGSWGNNKGTFLLEPHGFRVFAFREQHVGGTHCYAVDRSAMCDVTDHARLEEFPGVGAHSGDFTATRVTVSGTGAGGGGGGGADVGPLDRVLVVPRYKTPEMDYFDPRAQEFLHTLLDRYHAAGIHLNGLYSDEMHIQQDWGYFSHHENGQFALKYLTDRMGARFAELHGEEYRDLEPWMVYFCYGQHDFLHTVAAREDAQHVMGDSEEDIQRTSLFRKRYYSLLENTVVDLMLDAKHHAESLEGHRLAANYHVTWAESPTIDRWDPAGEPHYSKSYEYTSAFEWSNTVQQASAACQDYFRWGDYLTGGGNDHAEGGYADRDYFAMALACSQGILNDVPYSYAAGWGMPPQVMERHRAVVDTFGAAASPPFKAVEEAQHRDVDVLMLYPLDLVAVEERFGTWMTQYGYANYITVAKLLSEGRVTGNGRVEVRGRTFSTLVALFEPLPDEKLLEMMRELVTRGGRVVWSGPPPVLSAQGDGVAEAWSELFGVSAAARGIGAPGAVARFSGDLAGVPDQTILTHYRVDLVYPLSPTAAEAVVHAGKRVVGALKTYESGGKALALGFRPRDDQSGSLGQECRTWFEILSALGAYPPVSGEGGVNDNTEYLSRTTPYVACRFPNGTTAVACHYKDYVEGWPGGFHRNVERDTEWMAAHPLPSDRLMLDGFCVNGHVVTYGGRLSVAFRTGDDRTLVAFAGYDCVGITVDGRELRFADKPLPQVMWAPVPDAQRVPGGAALKILVQGEGSVTIPWSGTRVRLFAQGRKPGSRGDEVACSCGNGAIAFAAEDASKAQWVFAVPVEEE